MDNHELIPIETLQECYSSKELLFGDYVILRDVKHILNNHKLQWWLDGGSLIGALRHNSFVPVDDDIDICIEYREFYKILPQLEQDFAEMGYRLKPGMSGKAVEKRDGKWWPTYYQFFLTRNKMIEILAELYPNKSSQDIQKLAQSLWKKPQPYGDFLLMEELPHGQMQYLGDYYNNKPYDTKTIFPLRRFSMLQESNIMIPQNPKAYLMRSYNSAVSPITNAVIWNVHAPPSNPICNQRRKVNMLDKGVLQKMNQYLEHVFGRRLKKTTVATLMKYK